VLGISLEYSRSMRFCHLGNVPLIGLKYEWTPADCPISRRVSVHSMVMLFPARWSSINTFLSKAASTRIVASGASSTYQRRRSEEHTSELQSRENLVCRLLLEKKK